MAFDRGDVGQKVPLPADARKEELLIAASFVVFRCEDRKFGICESETFADFNFDNRQPTFRQFDSEYKLIETIMIQNLISFFDQTHIPINLQYRKIIKNSIKHGHSKV